MWEPIDTLKIVKKAAGNGWSLSYALNSTRYNTGNYWLFTLIWELVSLVNTIKEVVDVVNLQKDFEEGTGVYEDYDYDDFNDDDSPYYTGLFKELVSHRLFCLARALRGIRRGLDRD